MGSNFNFRGFNTDPNSSLDVAGGGGGSRPPGNFPLTRQSSIYSLTFDEFQNTMGGSIGKDFGSMNMDELLKSIWSAEEMQTMAATGSTPTGAAQLPEGLLRQGSLTLPRTLSQKTVDEVWKDISKELLGGSIASNGGIGMEGANMTQRQQTLKEITLEEFLVRAGVVREENNNAQLGGRVGANNGGYFGNNSAAALGFGFQQQGRAVGLGSTAISNGSNSSNVTLASANLPLSVNGLRSNDVQSQVQLNHVQPQVQLRPAQPQQHQHQHQHQQIFPKQANLGYATQVAPLQSSPGLRGGIVGIADHGVSTGLMPNGGMGISGLGGMTNGSPANQLSSDGIAKSNGDTSSVSPVPYVFNGGLRGRRAGGPVEKVVERRQRRMIKNRESAARSRARKQAYTMELEAEVAKLKEENQELRKKQEELMEIQKNQVVEMINIQQGAKRRCLRRTQTGPW